MSEAAVNFLYNVQDITRTAYQTRNLLRFVNNIRQLSNDVQDLMKKPDMAKAFWTLVQLMRLIGSLRRLLRSLQSASRAGALLGGLRDMGEIPIGDGPIIPPPFAGFAPMTVNVEAFRENMPMGLDGIDISMIPEESMEAVQRVLEADAPLTVEDARRILESRIIYPERSTGDLSGSISWMPQSFGTRIYAGMPYSWWVEQGQRIFTGHWYMRDATEEARMRLPQKIRDELGKIIKGEA